MSSTKIRHAAIATRRVRGAGRPERQAEAGREAEVFTRASDSDPPPAAGGDRGGRRTGYDTVGLRLIGGTDITPAYPLMDDKPLMRATKAAMAATGVGVLDIEFVRITPEIDVRRSSPLLRPGRSWAPDT